MSEILDKKLHEAIGKLNEKQKKAVLGIVSVFAEETPSAHWDDKNFVAEMNDRYKEYKIRFFPMNLFRGRRKNTWIHICGMKVNRLDWVFVLVLALEKSFNTFPPIRIFTAKRTDSSMKLPWVSLSRLS